MAYVFFANQHVFEDRKKVAALFEFHQKSRRFGIFGEINAGPPLPMNGYLNLPKKRRQDLEMYILPMLFFLIGVAPLKQQLEIAWKVSEDDLKGFDES